MMILRIYNHLTSPIAFPIFLVYNSRQQISFQESVEPGAIKMAKEPGTEIVKTREELPAELMEATQQDAGMGISFKQEDQLLPLIYVLQTNSPAVDKRGDNYVDGAEAGDFWLRNSLDPITKGEEGIQVIPCEMQRTWIEWLPNRQGFVARHDQPPADMEARKIRDDSGREKTVLIRRENENIIQDTREFYLLVDGQPYVLPCAGTKHTFARQWNTFYKQFQHPKTGDFMPAFHRKYRLTTIPASNAIGKWFGLKFQDEGYVTKKEYDAAKALCLAVRQGEKRAEAPDAKHEDSAATNESEIPF
jgi:hypothetical protein